MIVSFEVFQIDLRDADCRGCEGCGLLPNGKVYRVPKLAGSFCSAACIETALFGNQHCRWCGCSLDKPYTSLESRLCGDVCHGNYHAHVLGDRSARLGTGKRLILWLQAQQPQLYRH